MKTWQKLEIVEAIVAQHPNKEVYGRTRLQKTVYLLQQIGLDTGYEYTMHYYGPYSEELRDDLQLLSDERLVIEIPENAQDGTKYFKYKAEMSKQESDEELAMLLDPLQYLIDSDPTILELAATYDMFRRETTPEEAMEELRAKKGEKCSGGREAKALALLDSIGLTEKYYSEVAQ